MAKLIVTHDGKTAGEFSLDKPRITLGRAAGNDIQLDDATVSGKHARFHVLEGEVFVEDLESTNGTLMNGQKVRRRQLHNGDTLRIGKHDVRFVDDSAPKMDATVIISAAQREVLQGGHSEQALHGALKVLNGDKRGELIELTKAYNTVGKPGVQMAVVAKRSQGFFLVPMAMGNVSGAPKINDKPMGAASVHLSNGDVLEVAGVRMEFQLKG